MITVFFKRTCESLIDSVPEGMKMDSKPSLKILLILERDFVTPTVGKHINESSPFFLTMHRYATQKVLGNEWKPAAPRTWMIPLSVQTWYQMTSFDLGI
jgi:hypothetical protein